MSDFLDRAVTWRGLFWVWVAWTLLGVGDTILAAYLRGLFDT